MKTEGHRHRTRIALTGLALFVAVGVAWSVLFYPGYVSPVYFDWNSRAGFTRISTTPEGMADGSIQKALGWVVTLQARPFISAEFRGGGWTEAKGLCYVKLLPFFPVVYGLARGAEPWRIEDPKATPLMRAVDTDNLRLVKLLLSSHADVNARDQRGWTPLIHACMSRLVSPVIVQDLLSAGAIVDAQDKVGRTALVWAAKDASSEKARLLLIAHANPNIRSQWKESALMGAINAGSADTVALLLAAGADPNYKDLDGYTPLFLAELAGDSRIISLLQKAGAKS